MGLIVTYANLTWRDWNTDGLPSTGKFNSVKSDVRATLAVVENVVVSGISGAAGAPVAYAARATLFADLAHAAGVLGVVYNDATPANNGFYAKTGSSGSGAWSLTGLALPSTFATDLASVMAQLENIAAAAVSAASADAAAAAAAGSAVASANSSLSAGTYALSASASAALATSYITATATQFSALVHSDLAAAQGAASSAGTSAASAASSAALALTAANSSGPYYKVYATKAAATADLSNITANSFIIVQVDESQNGAKTIYQKVSGSLVFVRRENAQTATYPEDYGAQYGNTGVNNLSALQAAIAASQISLLPVRINGDLSTAPGIDLQPDITKPPANLQGRLGSVIRYTGTGTTQAELGLKSSVPTSTGNVDSGATLSSSVVLGDNILNVSTVAPFAVGSLVTLYASGGVYIPVISRARASNVATLGTDYAHELVVGQTTQVQGVTGAAYNGSVTITGTPDAYSFTYASVGSNEATTPDNGGGVVALYYRHYFLAEVALIEGGGAGTIGVSGGGLASFAVVTPGVYKSVPSIVASGGGGSGGVLAAIVGLLSAEYIGNADGHYAAGDVVTVGVGSDSGAGTFTQAALITIDEAIGGIPTRWHVSRAGSYTVTPKDYVAESVTTGIGTGALWNLTWKLVGANVTAAGSGYTAPAPVIGNRRLYLDRSVPWTLLSSTTHTIYVIAAATVIRDQVIEDLTLQYDGSADRPAMYPIYLFGMSRCTIRNLKIFGFPFGSTVIFDHLHDCTIANIETDALVLAQFCSGGSIKNARATRGKYFGFLLSECCDMYVEADSSAQSAGRGIKLSGCNRLTGSLKASNAANTVIDVEFNTANCNFSDVDISGSTNPGSPVATGMQFNGSGSHDINIGNLTATGNFSSGALFYVSPGDSRIAVRSFSGSAPNFSILGKDCTVRPVAPVLARVYRAANQSLSSLVTALFDSESWDTYNCWNSNTFTCLYPGYYRVKVRISVTGAWPSSPTVTLIIYVNGVAFDSVVLLGPENDQYIQTEGTVKLNVNDTIAFGIALSSGSVTMLGGASNSSATIEQV